MDRVLGEGEVCIEILCGMVLLCVKLVNGKVVEVDFDMLIDVNIVFVEMVMV